MNEMGEVTFYDLNFWNYTVLKKVKLSVKNY